jgi:hypothetical protein
MHNHVRHAERRTLDAGAPDSNATGSHADGRDADAGGFDADAGGFDADARGFDADARGFDADAGGFDADAWGASPSWHPSAGQSLYDDDDLDAELVPQARSLFAVPD